MKFFNKIFSAKNEMRKKPEDVMQIPRVIEPLLNKVALDIVDSHKGKLLTEPITYIVPAIWGAREKGTIDNTQEKIFQQVLPVINDIHNTLGLEDLNDSQKFAVGYMVKGLIISKISYMLEVLKNRLKENIDFSDQDEETSLARLEPVGSA